MKRAIIYGRTSTTKQSSESIETQIAECKKWCEANDCMVVDIYDDSGQSGRSYNVSNREGFQQIKEDAKNGKMDYALIHKIDRFARSVADYFIQERELEKYGVKVIVVGMPFFQNADIITRSVHIAMAEQFSVNLSNDVATKMRTFAHKKAFLGGRPPYGYMVVGEGSEKTLAIKEDEAEAIRMIFDLYLQGNGYINISKALAEKGFLNKYNDPFTNTHIRSVLKNKKYNGWYIFGDMIHRDGKLRKNPDRESVIEIPNAHPKIIDDETFNAVQERLASNGTRNKTKFRYYPFTGRITCGCCGRAMTGASTIKNHPNGNRYHYSYYKCMGKKLNGCKNPSIQADYLENEITKKVQHYVFRDDFVDDMVSKIETHLFGDQKKFKSSKQDIERNLKRVNGQIKEAMRDKYSKKIDEDLYAELVEEFNQEKKSLEIKLQNINRQIDSDRKGEEIREYASWLRKNISNLDDNVKNTILNQIVHSIVVTNENIDVYVHISSPPSARVRNYYRSFNISKGVPLVMLGKNLKVYTSDGFDLLKFKLCRK